MHRLLDYMVRRPIAVTMVFLGLVVVGLLSVRLLPVSLMPDVAVPQLKIDVAYPQGNANFIEQSILRPIRSSSQGLYRIKTIESIATSGVGQVELQFEYGTDMQMAYIAASEKIDQLMSSLPDDLERPLIRAVRPTDIPIARLQIVSDRLSIYELTDLTQYVLSRRVEQLSGVSVVQKNGGRQRHISVSLRRDRMRALGVSEQSILEVIESANLSMRQIKVHDGIYEYDISFESQFDSPEQISQLKLSVGDQRSINLGEVVRVSYAPDRMVGVHYFQQKEGVVLAIHKRHSARYEEVHDDLLKLVRELRADYPEVQFELLQDQSELLSDSVGQLGVSLVLGGVLAFVILFLFAGEWKSPIIIAVIIPVSILLTASLLYAMELSINIVTISGLILGVGILIDNGIIIIDNILIHREAGEPLHRACVLGVSQVAGALASSALTTLCVFVPLLWLGGTAGTLFEHQAISMAGVLVSSLLVSCLLLPVLFVILNPPIKSSNRLFGSVLRLYKKSQSQSMSRMMLISFVFLVLVGMAGLQFIPVENLPPIRSNDASILITWGDPVSLSENMSRVEECMSSVPMDGLFSEADIGYNQILESGINQINQALIYIRYPDEQRKREHLDLLVHTIKSKYPLAQITVSRAKNPYDQLFASREPYARVKLRSMSQDEMIAPEDMTANLRPYLGIGFQENPGIRLLLDEDKMNALGVKVDRVVEGMKSHLAGVEITAINQVNRSIPVWLTGSLRLDRASIEAISIYLNDSSIYPLSHFVTFEQTDDLRYITADAIGPYQSVDFEDHSTFAENRQGLRELANDHNWLVSEEGEFIRTRTEFVGLVVSIGLAILLLYVVLSAQFESFRMPLIILAEIPISISGALILLWMGGFSLNISSLIGIIITLGIIVNDSILKVDTINQRIRKGMNVVLAIQESGQIRLKPILMTTLTTLLALLPVLFGTGIGADLQKPLAISVIGGLSFGTLCSIYLVPVLYKSLYSGE